MYTVAGLGPHWNMLSLRNFVLLHPAIWCHQELQHHWRACFDERFWCTHPIYRQLFLSYICTTDVCSCIYMYVYICACTNAYYLRIYIYILYILYFVNLVMLYWHCTLHTWFTLEELQSERETDVFICPQTLHRSEVLDIAVPYWTGRNTPVCFFFGCPLPAYVT